MWVSAAYGTVFLQNSYVNAFIHYDCILTQAFKWCSVWAPDLIEEVAL